MCVCVCVFVRVMRRDEMYCMRGERTIYVREKEFASEMGLYINIYIWCERKGEKLGYPLV